MTSSPTTMPSRIPTTLPTSTLPTAVPSIGGSVVFIEMNTIVTASLTDEEVAQIINNAEERFDVYPGSVQAEVSYDITGIIPISVDGEYSEEELVTALQNSIADTLNIHSSDVVIDLDSNMGTATYTIRSPSVDDAIILQELLQLPSTKENISLQAAIELPDISLVTYFV